MRGEAEMGAAAREAGPSRRRFDLAGIGMTSQRTRDRLVKRLRDRLREQGIEHPELLQALADTPRHLFVDEALAHRAYEDNALPIGHGQTLSQPFVVALMTAILLDRSRDRVLEIGTGSGYQTAILARLCRRVFSIERIQALADQAQARLDALRIRNLVMKVDDGYLGWPRQGPFAGILLTAAPRRAPPALLDQLDLGGRMVAPVGDDAQELKVIDRTPAGFEETTVQPVRFVPMLKGVGGQGANPTPKRLKKGAAGV